MRRRILGIAVAAGAFVLLCVGLYGAYGALMRAAYPQKYAETVNRYAAEYGVPPSLIFAVIHTESHFEENAVSTAGAKGLMQLMDETYEWIQTKIEGEPEPLDRIFDPEVNIRCGSKLLEVLHGQFTHTETALAAYNAGSGKVTGWLLDERYSADGETLTHIPYEETENYVRRVLKAQARYRALYDIR